MSNLFAFLEMRRVEKGSTTEVTHTSMGKPKGSFSIRKNEMAKFFELYDKAYSEGEHLCLIERHTDFGPVVIDLDFEYLPDVDERQHDEEHIRGIVKLYQEEIINMFQLEEDSDKLTAFVFEKDHPYKKKEKETGDAGAGATTGGNKAKCTKDGIHIVFPFIVSTPEPQYLIRDKILDRIGTVLDSLPITAKKGADGKISYTNVVDKSVIQANGWFLFGSTKPGHDEYKITHIIRPDMSEIAVEEYDFNGMNPPRFFSIRNKNEVDIVPVREENLDIIGRFRATEQKRKEKKALSAAGTAILSAEEVKIIKEFVSIMSDQRATDYTSWIEVGWALHNLGPNNQELLDAWIEFSKRSGKYQEGECEALWENMKDDGLGIGSIRYWARLDSPDMYKKIIMNDINKMIECSIKMPTIYDIAAVLHRMFKYDYKFSPQGTWYYFDHHLWRENNDGIMLRNKISTDLCEKYAQMMQGNNKSMLDNSELTDEDKEDLKARNKEILSIIAKLRTTSFKDNIIRECRELFYDTEFLNKLDENFYLIGFQNGIYDLKRMEMREGRPDDCVTLTTRINKIEFSEDHEQWPELSKFIYTIFPKEEKRHYFMTFLATCLQGLNAEEKFRVWTGTGCHAIDTPIMMADGSWKMVQDITPGEQLMGDDSTPRNVLELFRGHSSMYRLSGMGFEPFVVNRDHILCLKDVNGNTYDISVAHYLNNKAAYQMRLYKRDGSEYDFEIEYVEENDFYGFQLDGNHRYVMADNIITHNSNGKSKLEELFTASFGDYTIKFPITLLTGKRAASNACSPELVKAKGKRIGYFVEPSEGERVNAGLMKEFTGGDKIYARGLNKDPIEFKPQFKLSLLCNDVPHFPPKDTGVWRRVEIVEFESKFVDSPNPENPNEFPIDKQVTEKIQNWKELFMAYLIDVYYAKYKVTGIKVPEEVLKFTIEYQKMFDMYSEFISRIIVETGVMTDMVTLSELHEEFKNWFLEMYNSPKVPTKHEFRQYMEKTYGKKRVTTMEVKGIKTKMKIEEEKRKKEAEEKALKVKDGDSDEEGGAIEDEDGAGYDDDDDFRPPPSARPKKIAGSSATYTIDDSGLPEPIYGDDEDDFEDDFNRMASGGGGGSSISKYFSDSGTKGTKSKPPSTTMVSRGPGGVTTTTTTTSYVNGQLVQSGPGGANPFANFPPIPGMPGGGNPFANFPNPFPQQQGQQQGRNTSTNNEYNISCPDDLAKLKIPGMDINDNPVLKALFTKDLKAIDELRRVEYKQTGPTSYQLPTVTLPPEKKVETYVDEKGNRTTTTTINTTNNIPTINFDGLPEGFKGNPFKLLADKMEEKILRSRRPPPPPSLHSVAAMMLATILAKKVSEQEEERRRVREERGEPEPSEEEKRRQAEEDEEKIKRMLENDELDIDIPPNHPMMMAFASMMKEMMRRDIEYKVMNDPSIPADKKEEVLREIFEEEDDSTGVMLRRRPETPPNFFRRGFMIEDEEEEKARKQREEKARKEREDELARIRRKQREEQEERDYLEFMRSEGREPLQLTPEEYAYEMARAEAIEREADEEMERMREEREREKKKRAAAAATLVPVKVEEVEVTESKKPAKRKVTIKK